MSWNICGTFLLLYIGRDADNVSLVFEDLVEVYVTDEIVHDVNVGFESGLLLDFHYLTKSITHYGNKHVHEDDKHDVRSQQESPPGCPHACTLAKV